MGVIPDQEWAHDHQTFEAAYWGDCANTFHEETKQISYARLMGMDPGPWKGGSTWPSWDMKGRSVLDIGGGPASMLLKCTNLGQARVVDPCPYPRWTLDRYVAHGIDRVATTAEDYLRQEQISWDEAWLYNVLQHTMDPERILQGMLSVAKTIRIFEWIDFPAYEGHPHELRAADLDRWVGATGTVVTLDEWYQPLRDHKRGRVEQKAWGGVFSA